jgi:hypothetical protein
MTPTTEGLATSPRIHRGGLVEGISTAIRDPWRRPENLDARGRNVDADGNADATGVNAGKTCLLLSPFSRRRRRGAYPDPRTASPLP